ncbi:MAG: NlpC/P60 family protein [Sulfurimonadaceae bacterium]
MFSFRVALLILALAVFSGCSTRSPQSNASSHSPQANNSDLDKLYPYHNKWHQTPYKLGGFGSNGIDCSAFVQRAYQDLFNMNVPRTTKTLANYGKKVSRSSITTSDLVFFKTGYNTRHVGIYLQNGDFMHASSSQGVIISSINDPYWKKRYWMTRRVK